MKILLTGVTGLVGWNFWIYSKKNISAHELFATANKEYSELKSFADSISYCKISDFEKMTEIIRQIRPDVIVHTAGVCDLDVCETREKETHKINVEGTRFLLEAASSVNLKHFIYISCDHVFSGENPPYHENSSLDPISIYGKTRVEAENLALNSFIPSAVLRAALPVGESLQGNAGPFDWFRSRTLNKKRADYFLDERRSVLFGSCIAKAIWQAIDRKATGLYHLGGNKSFNRFELANVFAEVFPGTEKYIFSKYRKDEKDGPPRVGDVTLDSSKAQADFEFDPKPITKENVEKLVNL